MQSHLAEIRSRVFIEGGSPAHTAAIDDALAFRSLGIDNTLDVFGAQCSVLRCDDNEIVFALKGIDAPIANALRRVMIAEVATMAIETCNIYQNTSIMQDEVLAHRLGLLPIYADPRRMEYVTEGKATCRNTLVFRLCVTCSNVAGTSPNDPPSVRYANSRIYSGDLEWVPQGQYQRDLFASDPPRCVDPDILICELRPGQSLELELFAEKGIGQTHAKWSPVCTASYKLQPEVIIDENMFITGRDAEHLVKRCPMNVFDIEDGRAVVAQQDNCTMCRECIRDTDYPIKLRRIRDHFIFTVESTGVYKASEIFTEALNVLADKCRTLLDHLNGVSQQ